jgi:diguanylate cyclase (GGDEF)-like protein
VVSTVKYDGAYPSWTIVIAFIGLVVVCNHLVVWVRVRSTRHGISWTDAAVIVGFAVLPPAWVVLATVIGVAAAKTAHRRPRLKVTFAVAKDATTTFAGGLVLTGLAAGGPADAAPTAGALAAAFVVILLLDPFLAIPVIAMSSRTSVRERVWANLDVRLVTAAVRLVVALGAVLALRQQPLLLYVLPLLILLAHLWHERWVRAREERQAWQDLSAATESFTGVELDAVLRSAVTGGARLFSADLLEVELWLPTTRRLVRGDAAGFSHDGSPDDAPPDDSAVYAVALHDQYGRRDIGAVRLRFRGQVAISEREQAMLASFAAALDTAVRTATAYGQLGEITAVHAHAAAHDPLTGLANRREFERRLHDLLAADEQDPHPVAVLLLDLKHFKEVNDALGHLAGDRVLVELSGRFRDAAPEGDVVARFGGDEFVVIMRGVADPAAGTERAEQIIATLDTPVEVDGLPIAVEANAGLALLMDIDAEPGRQLPRPDRTSELLRRADVAMYQAKRAGRRLVAYSPMADPADRTRLTLAGQLPRAVSQREFTLAFQPIVDLVSGQVQGAEALARWRHPSQGELEPSVFLDLLERSSQLGEFTAAVLDDALDAADVWRAAGFDLSVSVNISPRSLLDENLPRMVYDALDRHGGRPAGLCLELTETLAISQLETVDRVITRLHDIGVRLALDDFGTGYSSLAVLSRIAVHELKVDRGFVHALRDPFFTSGEGPGAAEVDQARAVVRSTVQLGRALDLTVVAEGIENPQQRRLLWEMGCALGQGHLFCRPVRAEQLLAALATGVNHQPGTLAEPLHQAGGEVIPLPHTRRSHGGRPVDGPR